MVVAALGEINHYRLEIVESLVRHVDIDAVAMRARVHPVLIEQLLRYFDQRIVDFLSAPFLKFEEGLNRVSASIKQPSRREADELLKLVAVASGEFRMIVGFRLDPVGMT